jgi:hypothetical protein
MIRHIGTRYTIVQAWRMIRRARRFAILREDHAIDIWLEAIR